MRRYKLSVTLHKAKHKEISPPLMVPKMRKGMQPKIIPAATMACFFPIKLQSVRKGAMQSDFSFFFVATEMSINLILSNGKLISQKRSDP
jgi:hypothetical protein